MLIEGKWQQNWQPVQAKDEEGRFIRRPSSFRNWITPEGSAGPTGVGGFNAEPGRYHLYVAYICPWACRTLMTLRLKGLDQLIGVTVVNPVLTDQGWRFGGYPGATGEAFNNATYVHELYSHADTNYTGRATVPILWDRKGQTIVNNESADIVRMLNTAFAGYVSSGPDLYPEKLASEIDELNRYLYEYLNNGVYQAGFASSQQAYEEAYNHVFAALDKMEAWLSDGRDFLFGDQLTESDIRLFVTLVRFDPAYHGIFKCNRNTLKEMPNLWHYTQRIWNLDGVGDTVNIDHIKAGYYSIKTLNPSGIVPLGPEY